VTDPTHADPQWVNDVMRELMDDTNIDAYGIDPWEVGPVLLALAGLGYKLIRPITEEQQ
jgi:phage terminase large subunit-like protein